MNIFIFIVLNICEDLLVLKCVLHVSLIWYLKWMDSVKPMVQSHLLEVCYVFVWLYSARFTRITTISSVNHFTHHIVLLVWRNRESQSQTYMACRSGSCRFSHRLAVVFCVSDEAECVAKRLFHCAGEHSQFLNKDQQAPEWCWHCTSILTCKYLYSLDTFMTAVDS